MKKIIQLVLLQFICLTGFSQGDCGDATGFCTGNGLNFPAGVDNGNFQPAGNSYSCTGDALITQPNATWYFFEISVAGNLVVDLATTPAEDIDFAAWGPYPDLATAQANCGSLPNAIDCSFSPAATETVNIANTIVGEVYLLMITNYSNNPTSIMANVASNNVAETDCSVVEPPEECNNPSVGSFNVTTTGSISGNTITLCVGDDFEISSQGDYTLPPPQTGEVSEVMYAVYNCAPPAMPDPLVDVCFAGLFWTGDTLTSVDPGGANNNGTGGIPDALINAGVTGTGGTDLWYLPVTMDDSDNNGNPNGVIGLDQNGDLCYDVGTPIQVQYLTAPEFVIFPDCDPLTETGSVAVEISGGIAPYSLSGNLAGNLSQTTGIADGGTVTINNLSDGDTYGFNITDANNCTSVFAGGIFNCNNFPPGGCENLTDDNIPDAFFGLPTGSASTSITNSGSSGTLGGGTEIVSVCVLIDHPFISDLELVLTAPDGTFEYLVFYDFFFGSPVSGADYGDVAGNVEVCFTPNATNSITTYTGGVGGNWQPEFPFSAFNGVNPNGNWTLSVEDWADGDSGTLLSWSIEFSNGDCASVCIVNNDDCTAPTIVSLTAGVQTCVPGCTIGATDNSALLPNACADITGPAAWYQFTTVDYALEIIASSGDISDLQIQFWDDCGTYLANQCEIGAGGTLNWLSSPGTGQTFLMSVSSVSGTEGQFDVCFNSFEDPSPCNVDNELVEQSSSDADTPVGGPYSPGETVEFCYTINEFQRANCNWLHGIVPTWGDCWTTPVGTQPTMTSGPTITTAGLNTSLGSSGAWSWYNDGLVQYNNVPGGALPPGTNVGGGWFFVTSYDSETVPGTVSPNYNLANDNPGDPNESYGDGYLDPLFSCDLTGDGFTWNVCFQLTTNPVGTCSNQQDCSVSVKTYGDGETGVWVDEGCLLDIPTEFVTELCCVDPPNLTNTNSCENASVSINSGYTGSGTVNWYSDAAGTIPIASGPIFNTPPNVLPGPVSYFAEIFENGCLSSREEIQISIDPLPDISAAQGSFPYCSNNANPITLTVAHTNVDNPINNNITWVADPGGNVGTGSSISVAPSVTTIYTVTASNACDDVTTVIVVEVEDPPTVDFSNDGDLCVGTADILITLTGNPPFDLTYTDGTTPTNVILNNSDLTYDGGTGEYTYTISDIATVGNYMATIINDSDCDNGTITGAVNVNTCCMGPIMFIQN